MRNPAIVIIMALLSSCRLGDARAEQGKDDSPAGEGRQLSIGLGELTLSMKAWGKGETLVMLPGLGRSASCFERVAPRIASAGYRVLAVNPRGIAGSKGPLEGLTLHDYANDVALLADKLGVQRVHILGWAYGSRIARCVARDHPGLTQTVTLLATGGKVPPDEKAMAALMRLLNEPNLSKRERILLAQRSVFSPQSGPSAWLRESKGGSKSWPEALSAQLAADRATPLQDWWAGGSAPMLVIQGLDDRIAPPGNGRSLKKSYGQRVRLIELERAGHALLSERSRAIADAVIAFLRDHPLPEGR